MNSENRSKIHADARTGEISQNYTHLLLIRLLIEQNSTQPLGTGVLLVCIARSS